MLPYEISLARTPAFEDALVLAAGADAMSTWERPALWRELGWRVLLLARWPGSSSNVLWHLLVGVSGP
jgi:hypothetical protein